MREKKLKCYLVVSPEIWEIVPVLDYGQGPLEYFKCCVYVKAFNKREAKIEALKKEEMKNWVIWQREDLKNPFSGLVVEEIEMKACEEEE